MPRVERCRMARRGSFLETFSHARPSTAPVPRFELETALRTAVTIAALPRPNANDLGHQTLHRETDAPMLAGQRRQWAACSADDGSAVTVHASQSSEVLVEQLACCHDARFE